MIYTIENLIENIESDKNLYIRYRPFAHIKDDLIYVSNNDYYKLIERFGETSIRNLLISTNYCIPVTSNLIFYKDRYFQNFFHPVLKYSVTLQNLFNNINRIDIHSERIFKAYVYLGALLNGKEINDIKIF